MAKRAEVTTHGRTKFGQDLLVFKPVWGIIGGRRSSREPPRVARPESRIFHPPAVRRSLKGGRVPIDDHSATGKPKGGAAVVVRSRKR